MHHLGRIPTVNDVVPLTAPAVGRIKVLTINGKRAGQLLISADEWKDSAHDE